MDLGESPSIKCSLCDGIINKVTHGFARLPCNHEFHIRCLIPACENYYSFNADIQCKMCLAADAAAAIAEAEPVAANTDDAALAAPVAAPTIQFVPVVDDAYQIADQKMQSYLKREKLRILNQITDADKNILNRHINDLRNYKQIKILLKKKLKDSLTNYRNDTKHLVSIFNDIFRNYLNSFIKSDEYVEYMKSIKKIRKSKTDIYQLYERLVQNDNRLMDLFNWPDIFDLLDMKEYEKVKDHYIPQFMTTNYFAHRFHLNLAFYDTTKSQIYVNKLFKGQLEPAEAEFLGEPAMAKAQALEPSLQDL